MKIKINSIMNNVYGEPLKSQRKKPQTKKEIEEKKPQELGDLTLKEVAVNSLLMRPESKEVPKQDDELKLYRLAIKIQDAKGEVDLTTDQIVEIKEFINKAQWPRLVTGQALELMEPK